MGNNYALMVLSKESKESYDEPRFLYLLIHLNFMVVELLTINVAVKRNAINIRDI